MVKRRESGVPGKLAPLASALKTSTMHLFFEDVDVETEVDVDVDLEEALADVGGGRASRIVVYNDDHNTFEWVIQCFMEILDHSPEQSEQLAYIIHFKGKATVKTAAFPVLKPLKDALVDRGLSAVIEGEGAKKS